MKLERIGRVLAEADVPSWERLIAEARETGQSLWDSGEAVEGMPVPDWDVSITHQQADEYDLELAVYVPLSEMIREPAR